MDEWGIFKRWYAKQFIPKVKKYQNSIGKGGHPLILLDNAQSHSSIECLNQVDEMFTVTFLPPNVTSVIQPMNQGVIKTYRRLY